MRVRILCTSKVLEYWYWCEEINRVTIVHSVLPFSSLSKHASTHARTNARSIGLLCRSNRRRESGKTASHPPRPSKLISSDSRATFPARSSAMTDYIGARLSLVSKSDIRYVGILHEIDSVNSTVSLEQVRSFGTEGRFIP